MAAKKKIDYDRIEPGWRAGIKSVRQLAEEYGNETGDRCSHTTIRKHFESKGIPRDLTAKIKAKAEEKVSKSIVSTNVSTEAIIEANADYVANIDIQHRKDVRRLSEIEEELLKQFQAIVNDVDLLEEIGEMLRSSDQNGTDKLNDLYNKVISFPGRVDSLKKLTETMKVRIELERKIIKLDDNKFASQAGGDVTYVINAV